MLLQQSSSSSHKPPGENRRRQSSLMDGLKLVTQTNISQAEYSSMVVSKKPIFYFSMESIRTKTKAHPCYNLLSNCHLCGRKLRLDKDVYMYKGDEGFCSVECRSRQMDLDGMREIEASTRWAKSPPWAARCPSLMLRFSNLWVPCRHVPRLMGCGVWLSLGYTYWF